MVTRPLRTFTITPAVPAALGRLRDLATNLRWAWDRETIDLFRRLDEALWEQSGHNPTLMLGSIRQERLDAAAGDDGFVAQYRRVCDRLDAYTGSGEGGASPEAPWFPKAHPQSGLSVAYFSAEFGLTECLAIYSGGLGVLSGDHLKSASDLGVPLVGVGLAYQEGYFRQYLNADGWQGEQYPDNDFYNLPLTLVRGEDGSPVKVSVELPGRLLTAQIWRVQVGRVPLFLLDANVPETAEADRSASLRLYSTGDVRIRQELLLGIGGVRALEALGYQPQVFHMNEGHSAFLGLERIRRLMETEGLTFYEAREAAAAGSVFTTHTPVPAGIDRFAPDVIDHYFGEWYGRLRISRDEFLALGRENPADPQEWFSMAVLAIHLADGTNGVSRLHGAVSRRLWPRLWPGVPAEEVPIDAVTNGVHALSFISGDMLGLYERYLGPRWVDASMNRNEADAAVWARANDIPGEELWRTHERRRERLVNFARGRLRAQLQGRNASPAELERAGEVLDPGALTIGFARRFATYKRGTLLLQDVERLGAILNSRERPVQIIFAGKAHPADDAGKELIREIVRYARRDDLRRRIVFIENYDLNVARYLAQGCDVWLNLPRRPLEASGTSGMKAALNGVLHLSVLDGWWAEAYRPGLGWAIGQGEEYSDPSYQDLVEARTAYELLEKEVVPLFYERGPDGLPRGWITMMKGAIRELGAAYNTNRMLHEYTERFYLPAARRYTHLAAQNGSAARALAAWKGRLTASWGDVRVLDVQAPMADATVGMELPVRAHVHLGALRPEDVAVQLYDGPIDSQGNIVGGKAVEMAVVQPGQPGGADGTGSTLAPGDGPEAAQGQGVYAYRGAIPCTSSGLHGYSVRVLPRHPDLPHTYQPGLITWAG
ncbi:MAG TPA: alpha-glucan family phosphorylase [Chloroflexota bacterium]|nr:alpha-glucan family phosphorylase [Chloroflexota bacterium]